MKLWLSEIFILALALISSLTTSSLPLLLALKFNILLIFDILNKTVTHHQCSVTIFIFKIQTGICLDQSNCNVIEIICACFILININKCYHVSKYFKKLQKLKTAYHISVLFYCLLGLLCSHLRHFECKILLLYSFH